MLQELPHTGYNKGTSYDSLLSVIKRRGCTLSQQQPFHMLCTLFSQIICKQSQDGMWSDNKVRKLTTLCLLWQH